MTVRGAGGAAGFSLPESDGGLKPAAPQIRLIGGRVARRVIVEERPLEPYAYDYDVDTGQLLRRTPLFFNAKPARVFDPNPVVTLNDPTLQDLNDSAAAVPERAYFDVELPDSAVHGPHVTLVDSQARNVPPPEGALVFNREDDGFEDVNAYFHIDRNQRYLQSLGYRGVRRVVPYAIEVDAHAASGSDNSFFLPSSFEAGKGFLYFGEGGTDDAEDADLLIHEYTHAIMEWIAPGTFNGAFMGEARALGEGIADYWAYSQHAAARRASGRDPFCFADWDARCALDDPSQRCVYEEGANCLRRLDSTRTMADYENVDNPGVEHRNGAIFSSALREIHDRIGKQVTDTIVIESLFGAPPRPTFATIARQMLEADRLLYQGTYAGAICSAMYVRGILTECDVTPRGEWTHFQGRELGIPIPENNAAGITSTLIISDTRPIERLQVRVDIAHPARGDLRIELIAPDGTAILLHGISSSRTPDVRETYGLTAVPQQSLDVLRGRTAAGEWKVVVSDRRSRDAGTLLSWGLVIQFAGEQPRAERPRGSRAQMIPIAGHVHGATETLYRSDVRVANVTATPQTAMLIFTRTGENGLGRFAAVQVALAAGQTVAFDDVVKTVFHTAGSGTLEVLGDVVVMSRVGGQQVPANLDAGTELLVAPLAEDGSQHGSRYNLGVAETAGVAGIVRVNDRDFMIEPFSHVQFPVGPETLFQLSVVSGGARIVAYLSQLDGDAMFIPAQRSFATTRIAPVITTQTSGDPLWRSDLWIASRTAGSVRVDASNAGSVFAPIPDVFEDVLARLFHRTVTVAALRVELPPGTFGATRIVSQGFTQFVPLLDLGGATQQLLFIESSASVRTNIGVVSPGAFLVEVRIYDPAGVEVERQTLAGNGIAQTRLAAAVLHGRAEVRFLEGTGRAYASVIGTDALFVPGQ